MMLEDMIEYRRALHRIPELENHLPKTCAFVKAQLQGLGCTVTEPIEGAVCAFFDEGKEDTLAFRADMDALPITEQTGLPFPLSTRGRCTPAATTGTLPCCWDWQKLWRRGTERCGIMCCWCFSRRRRIQAARDRCAAAASLRAVMSGRFLVSICGRGCRWAKLPPGPVR